jgi:hypothetical protein
MANHGNFMQLEMFKQIVQIVRHALDVWNGVVSQRVPAMSASVPADNAVFLCKVVEEGQPLQVACCPAMQHQDWLPLAGSLEVDFFSIIGKEKLHRKVPKKKTRRLSQGVSNGNYNRTFDNWNCWSWNL